jgi:hypothetical protein
MEMSDGDQEEQAAQKQLPPAAAPGAPGAAPDAEFPESASRAEAPRQGDRRA